MKGILSVFAIGVMLFVALAPATAAAADAEARPTRCSADVTLTDPNPEILDIHMSLNNLVLCGKGGEGGEVGVFDNVKGNGFYSIGDSGSTGGRLVVTGGRYTTADTDPERVIVVSVKSGPLRGNVYRLLLTTVSGCYIAGRHTLEGSGVLNSLTGRTNCTDASCSVPSGPI